jgi:hypothetical protein
MRGVLLISGVLAAGLAIALALFMVMCRRLAARPTALARAQALRQSGRISDALMLALESIVPVPYPTTDDLRSLAERVVARNEHLVAEAAEISRSLGTSSLDVDVLVRSVDELHRLLQEWQPVGTAGFDAGKQDWRRVTQRLFAARARIMGGRG